MRLLIVDDNDRVRRGIVSLLRSEPGVEVCGEAQNGLEALEKARKLSPEVVLVDYSMPGLSGIETAARLHRELPAIKILLMSQNDPEPFLPRVREIGASGCIDKSRLHPDLVKSLKYLKERSESPAANSSPREHQN